MQDNLIRRWYENWQSSLQDRYCYGADADDCSSLMVINPVTFFAFEWENIRFGKKVKEIKLKGTSCLNNS